MNETNCIRSLLLSLNICDENSITEYSPKVRDRDDVSVLKCRRSGVIFLSRTDHMNISHYRKKANFKFHSIGNRSSAINDAIEDTKRRVEQFKYLIANKRWLEVGPGVGAILDALSLFSSDVTAVEPQEISRDALIKLGYNVYPDIETLPEFEFDVVTLFHVFEHFINPIRELKSIKSKMVKGGKIIIEVPHANDFLLSFLGNEEFKKFTLWSEHLILHTRNSLTRFLEEAGFVNIAIKGIQRFPLSNHLHWLVKGNPGGHHKWGVLNSPDLDSAYSNLLGQLDKTDTLIAIAEKS